MTDNLNQTGSADRTRINVNEEHEVRYWTKTLGCTEDELRKAVQQAGASVEKVREYLSAR